MEKINQIIQKYIQGEASEIEKQELLEWIKKSPDNKKHLYESKDLWDFIGYHSDYKKYDQEEELDILMNKLSRPLLHKPVYTRHLYFVKIAALIVITFGLGWFINSIYDNNKPIKYTQEIQKIEVPRGQVNQVFLADGTRIWINSDSKMEVPMVFPLNERIVKLSGEAYFEVAKDEKRPFKVITEEQTIEVLGTEFNIRAYPDDDVIQTTLTSGKIKLTLPKGFTYLSPNQQIEYNRDSQKLILNEVDPLYYNTWKEGRFEFEDENINKVFEVIERWYDVNLIFDKKDFRGMYFSGVIKRDKPIEHFFKLMNHTIPITYKIDLDNIYINIIK